MIVAWQQWNSAPHAAFDECQIDTIYHEHFSYFSFLTVEKIFASHSDDVVRC